MLSLHNKVSLPEPPGSVCDEVGGIVRGKKVLSGEGYSFSHNYLQPPAIVSEFLFSIQAIG